MPKSLGPIQFTRPARVASSTNTGDIRGFAQAAEVGLEFVSNKITDGALGRVDQAVEDALEYSNEQERLGPDDIQSADDLSAEQFAQQYNVLRQRIANTSGSAQTLAINQARLQLQREIQARPGMQSKLIKKFNEYMSSAPEMTQAAQIDADRAQDTYGQDYVERITAITHLDWGKGGYGISEDIPVGSVEWAQRYKEQKAKRGKYDADLETIAILKAQGELKGPAALQAAHSVLSSAHGYVQGLMTDFGNELATVETNRVEGRLVPADQEAWAAKKPELIRQINFAILEMGNEANKIFLDDPDIIRDKPTYNAILAAVDAEQADLLAVLNAIKNDDFSIKDQMQYHSYLRGTRLVDSVPLLRNMTDVMQVEGGIFTALNDAGITNALKAAQVKFEEPLASAGEQLFAALANSTNDGATTTAEDPATYTEEKKNGERKLRIDGARSHPARVREAKQTVDSLTSTLSTMKGQLPRVAASEGLAILGSQWKTLSESKSFIFDGSDKAKIRQTAANPELERLALAAVNYNLPGLALESEQFETYWRSTSDAKDLDSFEAWHTELAELAQDTVPSVPYITNIMEVVRPLEFQQIQNDGEIHLVVNEKMIEASVREDLKRRGITEASLPSETAIAVGFAKKQAAAVSAEATKFLRVRSTRNIMANRLKKPDYLDAFFDPITGLDKIFTLDENVVSK